MNDTGIIGIILIGINCVVTWQGLKDYSFFEKYSFRVDPILIGKDYKRLLTSGFLHVSWVHLLFNMIALYSFSGSLEAVLGSEQFLIIYFVSLVGGDLLSLYIHRNHSNYSAVGASGAISGVVFASIAIFPGMHIGFIFLPVSIPGWLFGLAFVLFSVYGIKSQRGNIGHEAHLGGGIVGLITAILLMPESLKENYFPILAILIPAVIFLWIIVKHPAFLLVNNYFGKSGVSRNLTKEERYNEAIINKQKEIDRILDKISKKGIGSLTKEERETLDKKAKMGN